MDSVIPARAASVPVAPPRVELTPVKGSAPTELPQTDQSVAASAGGEHARPHDRGAGARYAAISPDVVRAADEAREDIERQFEFDDRADELVYQKVDRSTGEIVTQVPAEALVKLRAYVAELTEAHPPAAAGVATPRDDNESLTEVPAGEPGTLIEKVA